MVDQQTFKVAMSQVAAAVAIVTTGTQASAHGTRHNGQRIHVTFSRTTDGAGLARPEVIAAREVGDRLTDRYQRAVHRTERVGAQVR